MKTLPTIVEPLEARIAPAAVVFNLPASDGAADEILLAREGAQLVLAINGTPAAAWDFAGVDSLSIGGSGDDDTLVVDFDSGEAVPAGGLFFDGRAGFDSLDLRGGSFEREVSTPFDAHSGTIALDGRLIAYAGIEPVTNTTVATTFVIDGTATTDLIVITDGGLANGFQSIMVSSGEPSTFESVRFANKQVVFINGLGDDDTFNFSATTPAAGLAAIIMNGHSSNNAGDDSAFDIFNIDSSIAGVALVATGGGGSDQFFANGGTFNRALSFDGQGGADTLSVSGVTINGSTSDALTVDEIETATINSSNFTNNANSGIRITASGAVTLTDVVSTGNLTGLLADGVASLADTDGEYSRNDDHGLQFTNHGGNVTLNFSTLEDNDADNDNSGDGLNATSIGGDLLVRGTLFRDLGAAAHQERGIFVASIAGNVTITEAQGLITAVIGHESDGVRIDNGGALATITGSSFLSNNGDGLDLRSFGTINATDANVRFNDRGLRVENSTLTVTGGTFSNNDLHGFSLATVSATLTDVTAMNNLSRGIVADLIGTSTISGGTFSDNGLHGLELRGNSVAGATITLSGVTATGNDGDGLRANGFTDSGSTAPEITITGGTFSLNGVPLASGRGINLTADIGDALIENLTAANNAVSGINVDDAASVTLRNVILSQNGFAASDPLGAVFETVGLLSYTPTAGAVDDTFALSASGRLTTQFTDRLALGVDVDVLVLNGGEGRDVFKITPQTGTTVFVEGGAPTAAPGDVLEYNTERRTPTQSAGSITAPGVLPVNFSGIEQTVLSNNGLRLLNAKTAVYRDVDGDDVTIKINRGAFAFDDFTLAPQGLGAQLQTLQLDDVQFTGANLTMTAKRSATGGNGFANLGYLDATDNDGGADVDLGAVKIAGDLGRISAGIAGGAPGTPAVKSLHLQSFGLLGTSTQGAGASDISVINGTLPTLTVIGDFRDVNLSLSQPDARLGAVTIGGSLLGGASNSFSISAEAGIGSLKIGGDMRTLNAPSTISSGGTIGPVSVGGLIDALSPGGIQIFSFGQVKEPVSGLDFALKSLTVRGSVRHLTLVAGVFENDNADATIGPINIGGDWIASTVTAGVVAGPDLVIGTNDDAKRVGRDRPNAFSTIQSITIKGQAIGTPGPATDMFGIVAERIGTAKVGGKTFAFKADTAAAQNREAFFAAPTGRGAGAETPDFDFTIRELGSTTPELSLGAGVDITAAGKVATFTDVDGDIVRITTNIGSFQDNDFIISDLTPSGGGQLQRINLSDDGPEFEGAKITITATPGPAGGNGFVNVGFIDSTNHDLGDVFVDGDLGRLLAGDGDDARPAVKSLTAHSLGALGTSTQASGGSLATRLDGVLGKLAVKTDVRFASVITPDTIGSATIGGAFFGEFLNGGSLIADRGIGGVKIGGSVLGGALSAGFGAIGAVTIGGDLSAAGSGFAGIFAHGQTTAPARGLDLALKSLSVKGSVDGVLISVGTNDLDANADASIGAITVGRGWVASNVVAGVVAGGDFVFGTADDAKILGTISTRDVATRFSTIASLVIKGQALGTPGSGDHFGIVAEQVLKAKIGTVTFKLNPGERDTVDTIALAPTGPGAANLLSDFFLREVTL